MISWEFEKRGGVGVVRLRGRLEAENEKRFKAAFQEWLKETHRFVFDLEQMDFIDSTGLGALISCLRAAGQVRGEIRLARIRKGPRIVFEITRVSRIFDLFDDVEAAIESYA